MGLKSQEKNALIELIELINWKIKLKGIETNVELSNESGVPKTNLSRFFKKNWIHSKHIYSLLKALDLLNTPDFQSREMYKLYKELADTRKYNEILWTDNQKLREQLSNQIKKTGPNPISKKFIPKKLFKK